MITLVLTGKARLVCNAGPWADVDNSVVNGEVLGCNLTSTS